MFLTFEQVAQANIDSVHEAQQPDTRSVGTPLKRLSAPSEGTANMMITDYVNCKIKEIAQRVSDNQIENSRRLDAIERKFSFLIDAVS